MLPACSTDSSPPTLCEWGGGWVSGMVQEWGSKLSYQEVKGVLVYTRVLQKCLRLDWEESIWGFQSGDERLALVYVKCYMHMYFSGGKEQKLQQVL